MAHKLCDVVDEIADRIAAASRPSRIAGASHIDRENVEMGAQCFDDPVPTAAVVAPAVHQKQRRRVRISPVKVVQPQALRKVVAGNGTDRTQGRSSVIDTVRRANCESGIHDAGGQHTSAPLAGPMEYSNHVDARREWLLARAFLEQPVWRSCMKGPK